jgi:hypothetical protein
VRLFLFAWIYAWSLVVSRLSEVLMECWPEVGSRGRQGLWVKSGNAWGGGVHEWRDCGVKRGVACTNRSSHQMFRTIIIKKDSSPYLWLSYFLDCRVSSDLVIDRQSSILSFTIAHMRFTAKTSV